MNNQFVKILTTLICIALTGCSFSAPQTQENTIDAPVAALETTEPAELPTLAPTEIPTQEVLNPVTGEENPTPDTTEPPVEVIHVSIPGASRYSSDQRISDCNTGERKSLGVTTLVGVDCDNWNEADLERPVELSSGNYLPAVDIVRAQMGETQGWIFGKISLYQDAAGQIPANLMVMFEIDIDLDSRGEYLILAKGINSSEWTTNGVQVWWDQTGDVGGEKPHVPDGALGDGYETLLFDSGQGEDPDLAWVRISPEDSASVEFAFKTEILPENRMFAWWAWTILGELDPQMMEIVDSLTTTSSSQMDNTCSWIFNGKPTNLLKNICDFEIPSTTPVPTPTPQQSEGVVCPPGEVWGWYPWGGKFMCYDPDPT